MRTPREEYRHLQRVEDRWQMLWVISFVSALLGVVGQLASQSTGRLYVYVAFGGIMTFLLTLVMNVYITIKLDRILRENDASEILHN